MRWVAVEDIGRVDTTEFTVDGESLGSREDGLVEFWAWENLIVSTTTLNTSVGRVAICYFGKSDIHHIETVSVAAGRTYADDILYIIEIIEFVGIDADGWHTHAGSHDCDWDALVGTGVTIYVADRSDELWVSKESFCDEFGTQRIARHEDCLGESTLGS